MKDSTLESASRPFGRALLCSAKRWSASLPVLLCAGALTVAVIGCENPNPLAPVDPIGEYPVWGTDFGKDKIKESADSLVNQGVDKGAAPSGAENKPKDTPAPDAAAVMVEGRTVFLNNCARCHGPEGKGMNVAMIGQTANLQSKEIMGKSDTDLMNVIMRGKGNMPAFGSQLNAKQIGAVLQWLRAGTPKPAQ